MERLVTIRWRTSPPTSTEEDLVVYDDDTAWLVARRPRRDQAAIGSFVGTVSAQERSALTAAGADVLVDLLDPPTEPPASTTAAAASAVADRLRESPRAVGRFHGQAQPGGIGFALIVVGDGSDAVEFEIDPAGSAIHFFSGDEQLTWLPVPDLEIGFTTSDAVGLGGLRSMAVVAPSVLGVIPLAIDPPEGATHVSLQVTGWLRDGLPDGNPSERFEARTERTPIP